KRVVAGAALEVFERGKRQSPPTTRVGAADRPGGGGVAADQRVDPAAARQAFNVRKAAAEARFRTGVTVRGPQAGQPYAAWRREGGEADRIAAGGTVDRAAHARVVGEGERVCGRAAGQVLDVRKAEGAVDRAGIEGRHIPGVD